MTVQRRPTRSGKGAPRPRGNEDRGQAARDRRRGGVDIVGSQVHAAGDIVGHDKITHIAIDLLPRIRRLPYRVLIAVAVVALALLPSLTTAQPMSGLFNIAIADFGEVLSDGSVVLWDKSRTLRQHIYNGVVPELASIGGAELPIEIRASDVGLVQGRTSGARREAARRLAEALDADVLIYGNIEKGATEAEFSPEFYVRRFTGAEELLGPNQIGKPIPTSPLIVRDAVHARIEAVTLMTVGLTHLAHNDPRKAARFFEAAAQVGDWKDAEGKEVVFLMLGTAYMGSAYHGGDVPSDLVRARDAYARAVQLNGHYSRGYIGLGNVAYEQYRHDYQADPALADPALLDIATEEYRRAQAATDKPAAAQVDAKLHVTLGNVYLVKAHPDRRAAFESAEAEFLQVVSEYERGNRSLRDLAARAYLGLGAVHERGTGDYARAAEFYRKSIDTAVKGHSVGELARTKLRVVEERLGTPQVMQ